MYSCKIDEICNSNLQWLIAEDIVYPPLITYNLLYNKK
jgi:hypothetical protein